MGRRRGAELGGEKRGASNILSLVPSTISAQWRGKPPPVNSVSTWPTIPSETAGLGIVHKVLTLPPGYRGGKGEENLSSLTPSALQPVYEQCPQH